MISRYYLYTTARQQCNTFCGAFLYLRVKWGQWQPARELAGGICWKNKGIATCNFVPSIFSTCKLVQDSFKCKFETTINWSYAIFFLITNNECGEHLDNSIVCVTSAMHLKPFDLLHASTYYIYPSRHNTCNIFLIMVESTAKNHLSSLHSLIRSGTLKLT
jgi:hypothetical protein